MQEKKSLGLCPISLKEANAFVVDFHRHHKPVPGSKYQIGATNGVGLVGVIIVGRPVARMFDNGWTLEVTRCATDGTHNCSSMLYGAAARAAWALGYQRLITYTRTDEGGESLRGAGWKVIGQRKARSWAREYYLPRTDKTEPHERFLWEAVK